MVNGKGASSVEPNRIQPSRTQSIADDIEKLPEGNVTQQSMSRADSSASTATAVSETDIEAQRPSSTEDDEKVPLPVKVARSERRGLFGRYCFVAEVENARHYPRKTKWMLTAIVSAAGIAGPIGSAIILPALNDITESLDTTPVITNLTLAFYMLALGLFPLWWSFFSERYGRRNVYVISFSLFVIWNVLTAVSVDIGMLIVMRVLAGGASGSVQAVGGGTVADMWEPKERGAAMGFFYLGPLMGPLLSPIIGGALEIKWQWRSTGWFMVIYGGVTLLLLIFFLPETLHRSNKLPSVVEPATTATGPDGGAITRTSTRQTINQNTKRYAKALRMAFIDPLLCIKYLRFPPVALCIFYASITFASLYILQISIESTMSAMPYNFTPIEVGLAYLFNSVGYVLSSYLAGRWNDYIMAREARRAGRIDPVTGALQLRPEDRMRENAYLAAVMYPLAMLWYGWAAWAYLPWPVVLLPNFFFGLGSMAVFGLVTTMLTEFMPRKAASAIALNNACRNTLTFVGIFVAQPLLDAIGNGALFSGLTVITLACGGSIVAMKRYGPAWRLKMVEALKDE